MLERDAGDVAGIGGSSDIAFIVQKPATGSNFSRKSEEEDSSVEKKIASFKVFYLNTISRIAVQILLTPRYYRGGYREGI
jgi:hypothetical protein